MQLRTAVRFSDPSDQQVTLTLIGPLSGFEKLRDAIRRGDIPFYEVDTLLYQLDDVTRRLRASIDYGGTPPRKMVEGDL